MRRKKLFGNSSAHCTAVLSCRFVAPESESERDPFAWVGSLKTGEIVRRSPKNVVETALFDRERVIKIDQNAEPRVT